jgi:hypothetical protein
MQNKGSRQGTSFIDLLISMAIIAVLFGGIYLIYFSIVTSIANISVRTAATAAINGEIETVRNLPYDSVGTVGGVPAGVIPQSQVQSVGSYSFTLQTTVRNIDDPFDGTLGGSPNDTAPADYKLVSVQATCPLCNNFLSVEMTTTVAPKNLESATQNGSLFISALDANGAPISGVAVRVVNTLVSPSIDLTDTTNANGVLQLVGVPTSTQGYQIWVSKPGYSSDQTYQPGAPANPNPVNPYATVAAQTVTGVTFAIDRTSMLSVSVTDNRCVPAGNELFSVQGSKLIGTNPNVLKFATTTPTNAGGSAVLGNIEWDTYSLFLDDVTKNVVGMMPQSPIAIDPSSSATFHFIVAPAANPSLLVTPVDSMTGAAVPNASVTASKNGFSRTLTAGHAFLGQTDWSGGNYLAQSGGLDIDTVPGVITLLKNASGTYNTGTNDYLISNSFDLGGSNSNFYSLSWDPISQPGAATLMFQIAANNDNATWNFIGPDGTSGTFFTSPSGTLPPALQGNRYLSYKVYMSTSDENFTPELDDMSLEFSADCVPQAQTFFAGIPQGNYTVTATAGGYANGSTTVSVSSGAQSATVSLTHF